MNMTIFDSDFHNSDSEYRTSKIGIQTGRVIIDENIIIGSGSIIFKGVHIGRNAVVGARSVVTRDVPENAVVAGNHARVKTYLVGNKYKDNMD